MELECKECVKKNTQKWIQENKLRKKYSDKKYAEQNADKISEYQKIYRAKNKNKNREYLKKYQEKNRDILKEKKRFYFNKPEIKRRRSEYDKKRKMTDPKYRLTCVMRSAISDALKRRSGALRFLPYSMEELKIHLEKQFSNEMNWENYGSLWHIDHIVPISSFNFTSECDPDFLFCWSLSNLRPLLAKENLSKNAKRIYLL